MKPQKSDRLANLLQECEQLLHDLQEDGTHEVYVTPELATRWVAQRKTPARKPAAASFTTPGRSSPRITKAEAHRTEEAGNGEARMRAIAARIAGCTACPLHKCRNNTVPGAGTGLKGLVFIGEGPGAAEDRRGLPFVGPSGEVLDRLLHRMELDRNSVWIGNIVKCRASVDYRMQRDRPPTAEEMQACLPFLREQLLTLQPKVIVTLGGTALKGLFGLTGITSRRGKWLQFEGIPAMPTYHPSYLIRRQREGDRQPFWDVWDDMRQVLEKLGSPAPD